MNKTSRYDSIKCIWMASNFVEYKLCDRNFDCDNCLFDQAIRNRTVKHELTVNNHLPDLLASAILDLHQLEFSDRYTYLSNNLMLKPMFPNTYYFGFNSSVLPLFDNSTKIEHCAQHDLVSRGDEILKISGNWGEVTISSPIDYKCLDKLTNPKTTSQERWFCLIQSEKDELDACTISRDIFNSNVFHLIHELNKCRIEVPEVGTTMLDGGEKIEYLYQIIGNAKYKRLLNMLFNG